MNKYSKVSEKEMKNINGGIIIPIIAMPLGNAIMLSLMGGLYASGTQWKRAK